MIRPRRDEDLPGLGDLLLQQRPGSGWPVNLPDGDPLPLVRRAHEFGAWVAERDAVLAGHVGLVGYAEPLDAWQRHESAVLAAAHGVDVDRLGVVVALFVATTARGGGVGQALLGHATATCRALGLAPCLEVVAQHTAARRLYARLGWQVAGEAMPEWMPAGLGPAIMMVLP